MAFEPFQLGKYEFVEYLGRGGMAEVYRVIARGAGRFKRELAVKRILPGYWNDASLVELFEHEAHLNSYLSHPNIVQVYDFLKAGDTYLLVMEYVRGKNLSELLERVRASGRSLPVGFCVAVMIDVCRGLEYAHKIADPDTQLPLGIIHRDVSPQNIILSSEGAVKVLDFGIAKARAEGTSERPGAIVGKVAYMSPEQVMNKTLDPRTDVYSASLVLLELLTGKRVFEGKSSIDLLLKVKEAAIPKPSTLNPQIPPVLEAILEKGLAKKRADRYPSADALQRELQRFLTSAWPYFTQKDIRDIVRSVFGEQPAAPSAPAPGESRFVPLSPSEKERMEEALTQLDLSPGVSLKRVG